MVSNVPKEELHPISLEEAEEIYRGDTIKLIRAAYLRSFTPHEVRKCMHKISAFQDMVANTQRAAEGEGERGYCSRGVASVSGIEYLPVQTWFTIIAYKEAFL